jgi:hypothetical protein
VSGTYSGWPNGLPPVFFPKMTNRKTDLRKVIAIEPAVAGCPSHRSVRAMLSHTALTLDKDERTAPRDRDARFWAWGASAG